MSGRIVKLHAENWHWTCGDGCCDEWGTDILSTARGEGGFGSTGV